MRAQIDALLKEAATAEHERRSEKRHALVRPVTIYRRDQTAQLAFSRDISHLGIGLIHCEEWSQGTLADLEIHPLSGKPVCIKAEVRWSRKFGEGWYLIGWKFIALVNLPISSQA